MNRYPVWKYAIIVIALVVGALYTLPNFFGEAPAVQVSAGKATARVDTGTQTRIEEAIKGAGLKADLITFDGNSVKARFDSTDNQLKAKDAIQKALIPDPTDPAYVVALNLVPRSPAWLSALHASPMYLGLDLRGGVHFMLQVDMQAALNKKAESLSGDIRSVLREKNLRHGGISRNGQIIEVRFRDSATLDAAKKVFQEQFGELQTVDVPEGAEYKLTATIRPEAARKIQEQAVKQNITTLAQSHQRARRRRAGDPAAGTGPHRGAVAGRAGHRQGEGHPGAHSHPGNAAGG
jgi:preprotein translocase subunit SecD